MSNKNAVILAGGISSRMKKSVETDSAIDKKFLQEAESKSKSMISVGNNGRPFLDYLLYNICESGYQNALIVIGEKDNAMKEYYSDKKVFPELNIKFAVQHIPSDRVKPFGTADALFQGLSAVPEWKDESFTVMNSDNLYSQNALKTLLCSEHSNAMIDYDAEGFQFSGDRVKAYAVTVRDENNFLADIIEKPSEDQIISSRDKDGVTRVSMNIFKLKYNMIFDYLKNCPVNPVRNEKELPTAIKNMLKEYPKSLYCYPVSEHVPDLTNKDDIIPTKKYLEEHFHNVFTD
ncbi:MAG: sugar phosphate nucleotidyltransferase [Rhodothermaceae bacterium]